MQAKWTLTPNEPTTEMRKAGDAARLLFDSSDECAANVFRAMLAVAPPEPHTTMTPEDAREIANWRGMDGAIAFHLIERHADGWSDVGLMMDAWLKANAPGFESVSGPK